jgi:dolichol-phosphate mannosyltransferase
MSNNLVIIPTYNEIENIRQVIHSVFSLEEKFHILVVDDGSPDGTSDAVKELMLVEKDRLFIQERAGKLGLGTAYIHGFNWALPKGYDYIFEMDADFSHNPKDLISLLHDCREGEGDMSIGSRYVTGVNVVNWPMNRVLMSYFASVYVRWVTRMPIRDATAGFKCYSRKVLETIDLNKIKFVGYAFQIEMKFTAWKFGFNVVEVPIIFTDRKRGKSKMHSGIFKEAVLGVIQMKTASWFKTFKR